MSKEQINYLLVLATFFIVWLYFNTFLTAVKINPKMNYAPGMGRSMTGDWSQRQPFAMPAFPKSQDRVFMNQPPAVPPEIQKLMEARKAQGSVPAGKK